MSTDSCRIYHRDFDGLLGVGSTGVARLHLAQIGVKLTTLSKEQAEYLGVPVEGPYKPDHCRY